MYLTPTLFKGHLYLPLIPLLYRCLSFCSEPFYDVGEYGFAKNYQKISLPQKLDLQAPYSLLEALKQHLASLEEKNDSFPPYR